MFNFFAPPPLSLYIHVPWCVRKCPYCDFNSHRSPDSIPEQAYIDALIRDLEQELPAIWGRPIQTIFIGGGTPSLLSAEAYDKLFSNLRALLPISPHAEITMEANPGTVEAQRFADYHAIGINRLSLGIQSFNDDCLAALGRIHDSKQALNAVDIARKAGFDNFNLDLMFGLPGQNEAMAAYDIETAITLEPAHISYYQLTIEPNTLFYQQPPRLPEDDPIFDWQIQNQQRLATAGYEQYEVSAYAKAGKQCQHNINYWQFGDYLGIGAGAHGKITDVGQQKVIRRIKQKQPQAYIDSAGQIENVLEQENITENDIGFEFMLNALRLTNGFPTSLFMQHTGIPLSKLEASLVDAEQQGLLFRNAFELCPTEKGRLYLNTLIELFLPE